MQTNDFTSTSTTDIPVAVKTAGAVEETKEQTTKLASEESGETAEIKAQDAVETDDQGTEADDKDVEGGDDDQEKAEAKPKKKGGFQKKLERKDREIEFLKEQLARQQQPQPSKEVEKAVESGDKPNPDKFDSQAEYIEALTEWKLEQKLSAQKVQSVKEQAQQAYTNRITEFQKKTADFSRSVEDYEDVIEDVSDVMLTMGLQESILDSEMGPEILYNLAKNKAELMRINKLSLVAQAREIGKLEARLAKSKEKPEPKQKTAAPPPPKPVGTKSPGKVVKDPSEMSPDEYIAWRRKK